METIDLLMVQLNVMRSILTAHGLWGEYNVKFEHELKRRKAEKDIKKEPLHRE